MAISMLKIRWPLGRPIFNMGIAIPGKTVFLIETAPWWCDKTSQNLANIVSVNDLLTDSITWMNQHLIEIQTFLFTKMHLKISSAKWVLFCLGLNVLTHWGRVMYICVGNLAIIGSDNGLVPGRHQAIIWTNDWILLIGPLGTKFSEILIGIQTFSLKIMHLKM